ncbi:MAG: carboxy-S-adenosyl-L-methionine synthase CmoA [Pseudomonadales bacterium]|nr:carboxy-S-adenosyl-L-methionine synthase CmoA [Pseudomonadales bacterium]
MSDNSKQKDNIYASPQAEISRFSFDNTVVEVFEDMIERSVPGYNKIIQMTEIIAQSLEPNLDDANDTKIGYYDLGCSLGASLLAIKRGLVKTSQADPNIIQQAEITGVDNSAAMIKRCQHIVDQDHTPIPVTIRCESIEETPIDNAMLVTLNFTLQFIPLENRLALLSKIHSGMNNQGALILSEKVCFDSAVEQEIMERLHYDFKSANGYSEMEISQKRSALENVLVAETIDAHKTRLSQAGFSNAEVWFQCFNFVSLIAYK